MLTGSALGTALAEAITKKGVTKAAVARHFGIKGPSIHGWINDGRIGKKHITELVAYFSDVVEPSHWGLPGFEANNSSSRLSVKEPQPDYRWVAYENAGSRTRAAVDVLLMPLPQRSLLIKKSAGLTAAVELIERHALEVVEARKRA